MGVTYIGGTATGPTGKKVTLDFLVDSGVSYSLVPHDAWKEIELTPKRTLEFRLADGSKVSRQVSECHLSLEMGDAHTPVILGEPGDDAILGVVTLENLGLVLDPFSRTLRPMQMLLV